MDRGDRRSIQGLWRAQIHGIALTAFDGSGGYFDHIYFTRAIAELDAVDATGLSERKDPLVLKPEQVGEHYDNLSSADILLPIVLSGHSPQLANRPRQSWNANWVAK